MSSAVRAFCTATAPARVRSPRREATRVSAWRWWVRSTAAGSSDIHRLLVGSAVDRGRPTPGGRRPGRFRRDLHRCPTPRDIRVCDLLHREDDPRRRSSSARRSGLPSTRTSMRATPPVHRGHRQPPASRPRRRACCRMIGRSRSVGRPMSRLRKCWPTASSGRSPHSSCACRFHTCTCSSGFSTTTPARRLVRIASRKLVGVVELAGAVLQLVVDRLQLVVGRLELLVHRLELLVGRLELLVGRLQLLHRGLEFLVGGLQLLVGRLQLLVGRLELPVGLLELVLQPLERR